MAISAVSPLLLQRYEMKYLIPVSMIEPISRYLEGHCEMDYYSRISSDHFYTINSLYFDTQTFQFLMRKRAGLDRTFSMRVRSYGLDPKPPYYAEIKLKVNGFSNKMRSKLDSENWAEDLSSGVAPQGMDERSKQFFDQFAYLLQTHGAEPKILTQYRRKAYLSSIDNYARVTFDLGLRYQLETGFRVKPSENAMCHYDNEDIFAHPEECVVLELKCEKRVPLWMVQMVRKFDLMRTGFSKYGNSINENYLELDAPYDRQSVMFR